MPLIKSKSKKAFSHNVAAEMDAGKPQKQALAVAFSVARKAKPKKMAKGGVVKDEQASSESRPMPDDMHRDALMANQNRGRKAPKDDQWLDNPSADAAGRSKASPHSEVDDEMADERADADNARRPEEMHMMRMAHGGMAGNPDLEEAMRGERSLADEVRMRRKAKMMADGGMVDIEENGEEEVNHYYEQNRDAALKELYDDNQMSAQPEDSNEHGHEMEDENDMDMIDAVRRRIKAKRSI